MISDKRRTVLYHNLVLNIFVLWYCAFDTCYASSFQQYLTPQDPARSQFTLSDAKAPLYFSSEDKQRIDQLSASSNKGFLPGIGTYFQPYSISSPRDVRSPATSEAFNPDSINAVEQFTATDRIDPGLHDPAHNALQAAAEGHGKCTFVQMKGTPLPNMNCQEGGMACDKQCGIVDTTPEQDRAGQKCVTVMEEMCREVPKQDCRNVTGKVCNNIADEICEPVQVLEPLTR